MANFITDLNKMVNTIQKSINLADKIFSEKPKPKVKTKKK